MAGDVCKVEKLETGWQNLVSEPGSLGRGRSLLARDDGIQRTLESSREASNVGQFPEKLMRPQDTLYLVRSDGTESQGA